MNFAKKFNTIFLSTGAALVSEIKNSYKILKKENSYNALYFSIPCNDENVNLNRINDLKNMHSIGLSDHTPDILSSIYSLPHGVDSLKNILL